MIHITTGPAQPRNPDEDDLGRSRVGFDVSMSDQELYEANHGCWVLGERADREQYALISFGGQVRQAIEIESIDEVPSGRRCINGRILQPGDAVYDAYVGEPSPVGRVRNPITYVDAAFGARLCGCGCGRVVGRGDFAPGHDQRAIHDRVARIGSTADFLRWFDAQHPDVPASS